MNINNLEQFNYLLENSTDDALKEILFSTGTIKREDLNLAVDICRFIATERGQTEIVRRLAHFTPGAIEPAAVLVKNARISELTFLMSNDINGIELYDLWNDKAFRNQNQFIYEIKELMSNSKLKNENDIVNEEVINM